MIKNPLILFTLLSLPTISGTANANDAAMLLEPAFNAAESREFDTAIDRLSTLASTNEEPVYRFHLARIQHRAGEYDQALETIEGLTERHPDYDDAHYLAGLIHLSLVDEVNIFRKVGTAKRALESWQQAVAINPDHIDARYAVFAFYANAPGMAGGDMEEAKRLAEELDARNPGYGAMASAVLATKTDEIARAEAALIEAATFLDRAGPHFVLAQHYASQEQWENVLAELDLYTQKEKRWWDPDVTAVHLLKARALAGLGNTEAARREAKRGLSLSPNKQIKGLLEDTLQAL